MNAPVVAGQVYCDPIPSRWTKGVFFYNEAPFTVQAQSCSFLYVGKKPVLSEYKSSKPQGRGGGREREREKGDTTQSLRLSESMEWTDR